MTRFSRLLPALLLVGTVTAISAAPGDGAATDGATAAPPKPLSDDEMKAGRETLTIEMRDEYRDVMSMKERAQKAKDVVKVTCVNDKLVQIKAQMNLADTTGAQLQLSLDNNAADKASLYESLTSTRAVVHQLREDAAQCLGELELFKQESGVEVDRPDIPDDPSTIDPYNPGGGVDVEPPGYASAFS